MTRSRMSLARPSSTRFRAVEGLRRLRSSQPLPWPKSLAPEHPQQLRNRWRDRPRRCAGWTRHLHSWPAMPSTAPDVWTSSFNCVPNSLSPMPSHSPRRRPGEIRDAIEGVLADAGAPMHTRDIHAAVEARFGATVAGSSVRSYLRLNSGSGGQFTRVGHGIYFLA